MMPSSIPAAIASRLPASLGSPADLTLSRGQLKNTSTGLAFVAKLVVGDAVAQARGESEGLRAMRAAMPAGHEDLVPELKLWESWEESGQEHALMLSDYHPTASLSSVDQTTLGRRLAEMHSAPTSHGRFGFDVPTHCGVTEQDNTWEEDWPTFWRDRRLGSIVARIDSPDLSALFEEVEEVVLPLLLQNLDPPPKPAILHGDLWSGNVARSGLTGQPFIFDCASYYGHNEADLGITHMFGGFRPEFYEAYHSVLPRSEPYYAERQKLYEVYHHLNHWLMFGGSYRSGSMRILRDLVAFAREVEGEGEAEGAT